MDKTRFSIVAFILSALLLVLSVQLIEYQDRQAEAFSFETDAAFAEWRWRTNFYLWLGRFSLLGTAGFAVASVTFGVRDFLKVRKRLKREFR